MQLFLNIKLKLLRINRSVLPEAKRIARWAWLGLQKVGGESLIQLFFRLSVRELIIYLIENIMK